MSEKSLENFLSVIFVKISSSIINYYPLVISDTNSNNEIKQGRINYLTPNQKLLKLTIEDSLKENSKGQRRSTDLGRKLMEKLIIYSHFFVTEFWLDSPFYTKK